MANRMILLKISVSPELQEALDEAEKLLTESFERPLEIIKRFLKSSQIITSEPDLGFATGTSERFISLKPSDRFLEFLAALRAGDIDSKFV